MDHSDNCTESSKSSGRSSTGSNETRTRSDHNLRQAPAKSESTLKWRCYMVPCTLPARSLFLRVRWREVWCSTVMACMCSHTGLLQRATRGRQSRKKEQRKCERRVACEPAVEDEDTRAIADYERREDCLINYLWGGQKAILIYMRGAFYRDRFQNDCERV